MLYPAPYQEIKSILFVIHRLLRLLSASISNTHISINFIIKARKKIGRKQNLFGQNHSRSIFELENERADSVSKAFFGSFLLVQPRCFIINAAGRDCSLVPPFFNSGHKNSENSNRLGQI
jgi:hypothetical protein